MIKTFRFALLACGLVGGALTATAAPAVPVRVATVELAPHAEERAIPGRVEAIRAVDIRARTEGVIVQRHFQDGQYVTEGDLLFTLDDAQPRAALALAQAELKSAEASLRQSQQLLTRYERLINNHRSHTSITCEIFQAHSRECTQVFSMQAKIVQSFPAFNCFIKRRTTDGHRALFQ